MERSGVKHCSPLHVSALFFEAIFERQCAHAEPPAPPARAAKVSSLGTNESPTARSGRPRAPSWRGGDFFFAPFGKPLFCISVSNRCEISALDWNAFENGAKNFRFFFVLLAEGDFQVPLFMGFAYLPRAARRAGAARTWRKWLSMHRRACVRAAAPSRLYFCAFASHLAQDTSC